MSKSVYFTKTIDLVLNDSFNLETLNIIKNKAYLLADKYIQEFDFNSFKDILVLDNVSEHVFKGSEFRIKSIELQCSEIVNPKDIYKDFNSVSLSFLVTTKTYSLCNIPSETLSIKNPETGECVDYKRHDLEVLMELSIIKS